jgi:hypothetical protein
VIRGDLSTFGGAKRGRGRGDAAARAEPAHGRRAAAPPGTLALLAVCSCPYRSPASPGRPPGPGRVSPATTVKTFPVRAHAMKNTLSQDQGTTAARSACTLLGAERRGGRPPATRVREAARDRFAGSCERGEPGAPTLRTMARWVGEPPEPSGGLARASPDSVPRGPAAGGLPGVVFGGRPPRRVAGVDLTVRFRSDITLPSCARVRRAEEGER